MTPITATVAAIKGLVHPTLPLSAKWSRIPAPSLPRSSHTLSVVTGRAYIFGGEVTPREPVDNDMHIITLTSGDYQKIPATASGSSKNGNGSGSGEVPEKRVGHTAAVIGERIFVFGGRGGKDMKPLEEKGRVWIYDTRTDEWSFLDPIDGTPYPEARSYHSSVAMEKPETPATKAFTTNPNTEEPAAGTIAENAKTDAGAGGHGTFFVHAGCPASGRTGDLWGFNVRSRTWKEFPTAPGKPRGGTAIAVSKSRIYRYGGFNGVGEEGGQVDVLELALETFSDKGGKGELTVTARGGWETLDFEEENMKFPGKRSVAGLQTVTTGMGREYLVLLLGERDPSSQGHDGAGKFWGDVWTLQVAPHGMTGASFKDATKQAAGKGTGEGLWSQANVSDAEGVEGEDVRNLVPGERGWFASSSLGDLDASGIVLWGGLNGKNERQDNGWILRVE